MNDHTKPTTYFQMQLEREQQLALDAETDGHDSLRLQAAKRAVPVYPQQPSNVWNGVDNAPEPPTGESIDAVKDVSKVGG
jgi:hypothetical protein